MRGAPGGGGGGAGVGGVGVVRVRMRVCKVYVRARYEETWGFAQNEK